MAQFKRALFGLSFIFIYFMAITVIQAFQVEFEDNIFIPAEGINNKTMLIANRTQELLAVEIFSTTRVHDKHGEETNEATPQDFLIYPAQLILDPGTEEIVTLVWSGDPNPAKELAYRIIVKQVAVSTDEQTQDDLEGHFAKFKILKTFKKSAYIQPTGAEGDVALDQVIPSTNAKGEKILEAHFTNNGTAHEMLLRMDLTLIPPLSSGLQPVILKNVKSPNILAGDKRIVTAPWPQDFPFEPLEAEFKFERHVQIKE